MCNFFFICVHVADIYEYKTVLYLFYNVIIVFCPYDKGPLICDIFLCFSLTIFFRSDNSLLLFCECPFTEIVLM